MSLHLGPEQIREIARHGADAYPHECCGAILGHVRDDRRVVERSLRLENARTDSARNRFRITDGDYLQVERHASELGLALLGFYHSHPDQPAHPSRYDLDHAFPWFSYVIVAVAGARPGEMTSWVLAEDRTRFIAQPIVSHPPSGDASTRLAS
jgi:proteasome lid subunit RPN8/RPN11